MGAAEDIAAVVGRKYEAGGDGGDAAADEGGDARALGCAGDAIRAVKAGDRKAFLEAIRAIQADDYEAPAEDE